MEDKNEAVKKFQKELYSGTAALVLLSVMGRADSPMYGYQIARFIEANCPDEPIMKQGALYPVLRTLESSGLLESEVEPSVSGPPRRYYRITDSGKATLKKWQQVWSQTKTLVDIVLQGGDK